MSANVSAGTHHTPREDVDDARGSVRTRDEVPQHAKARGLSTPPARLESDATTVRTRVAARKPLADKGITRLTRLWSESGTSNARAPSEVGYPPRGVGHWGRRAGAAGTARAAHGDDGVILRGSGALISSATPATVGLPNTSPSATSTPSDARTRATIRQARREWPPRSKKSCGADKCIHANASGTSDIRQAGARRTGPEGLPLSAFVLGPLTSDTQLLPLASHPVQPVGPALLVNGTTHSSMVSFSHKPDLLRDKEKQQAQVNAKSDPLRNEF